ncbi:MAG TPA: SgcJ/EcaC family oxidoreductase [Ktedonobacterales bacterium]
MSSMQPFEAHNTLSPDESAVRALYQQVLHGWNTHSGAAFAAPFTEDGETIGFDGSQLIGRADIATTLNQIFADHVTAAYVAKVRNVRMLGADAAILRAVVGMVPPGQSKINPAVNAIQTLVATRQDGTWRVALLQSTPAQLHGRPELVERLTEELQQLVG